MNMLPTLKLPPPDLNARKAVQSGWQGLPAPLREHALLVAHGRKADVLRAIVRPPRRRVLLRKKPWHDLEEYVQRDRA